MPDHELKNSIKNLFTWYSRAHRILPWRETADPYRIWVSEVMLQQTQVDRVLPKYHAFLEKFPDVAALASTTQADAVRMWAGLGYNRRALHLWRGAQFVVSHHGGVMPRSREELLLIPGIGEYTARAILSFAYHEPVTLIDTNHRRVVQRLFFGQPKNVDTTSRIRIDLRVMKKLDEISTELKRKKDGHYIFNQALMDFGATVCTSSNPKCETCPLRTVCKAGPQFASGVRVKRNVLRTTQSKFEGSDRWYRGKIVHFLREHEQASVEELGDMLGLDKIKACAIMDSLVRDGLVRNDKGRCRLA